MEKQIIARDRQEAQAADTNRLQDFAQQTFDDLVRGAVTPDWRYVGMGVSQASSTEVKVETGQFYQDGRIYSKTDSEQRDLFGELPVEHMRYVTIVTFGETINTDVQARDFLINLDDETTEPQSVAMVAWRRANIDYVTGTESASPTPPAVPSGAIRVADVLLNTSQIVSINQITSNRLVSNKDLQGDVQAIRAFNRRQSARIDGIQSNVMSLGRKQERKVNVEEYREVLRRLARIGDIIDLPDTRIDWGGDWFLNTTESDASPGDYDAVVAEGIRFPDSNNDTLTLSLFNSSDPAVNQLADGSIIPVFDNEVGMRTPNWGDSVNSVKVSQYTVVTWDVETRTRHRERLRHGDWQEVFCTNAIQWDEGQYDAEENLFSYQGENWQVADDGVAQRIANGEHVMHFRARRAWWDRIEETYNVRVRNTTTTTGTQIAQNFMIGNERYLTRVGIIIEALGPDSSITMAIHYADEGEPSMIDALAETTMAYNDLVQGEPIYFEFPPILLEANRTYAIVLITSGDHSVRVEPRTNVLDGDLLHFQDDDYHLNTDSNGNPFSLMCDVQFAAFRSSRATVRFNDLSLNGGISAIDVTYGRILPGNSQIHWEVQIGGTWKRIPPPENPLQSTEGLKSNLLSSKPSTVPLRAVMKGSGTLMPTIELGNGSRVIVSRPDKVAFKHYSTSRTLSSSSTSITVVLQVNGFDSAIHTLSCTLQDNTNATTVSPSSTSDTVLDSDAEQGQRIRREFTFSPGTATSDYQVITEGTRSATGDPQYVVENRFDYAQ